MIMQLVITSIAVLGLVGGSVLAAETPSQTTPQQPAEMVNPFAWMIMTNQQYPNAQRMNLARPEAYVVFINPMNYGQFMNPATYGQFMAPQFYMQFADPNNTMAWMNPAAYGAYMNPAS